MTAASRVPSHEEAIACIMERGRNVGQRRSLFAVSLSWARASAGVERPFAHVALVERAPSGLQRNERLAARGSRSESSAPRMAAVRRSGLRRRSLLSVGLTAARMISMSCPLAWAQSAICGPSQHAISRVRACARRSPELLAELGYTDRPACGSVGAATLTKSGSGPDAAQTIHLGSAGGVGDSAPRLERV